MFNAEKLIKTIENSIININNERLHNFFLIVLIYNLIFSEKNKCNNKQLKISNTKTFLFFVSLIY